MKRIRCGPRRLLPSQAALRRFGLKHNQRCVQWILGLVDETKEPHALLRHRFRSKVGGRPVRLRVCSRIALPGSRPHAQRYRSLSELTAAHACQAWLDPVRLPAPEALTSQPDGSPLIFLLQVA